MCGPYKYVSKAPSGESIILGKWCDSSCNRFPSVVRQCLTAGGCLSLGNSSLHRADMARDSCARMEGIEEQMSLGSFYAVARELRFTTDPTHPRLLLVLTLEMRQQGSPGAQDLGFHHAQEQCLGVSPGYSHCLIPWVEQCGLAGLSPSIAEVGTLTQ